MTVRWGWLAPSESSRNGPQMRTVMHSGPWSRTSQRTRPRESTVPYRASWSSARQVQEPDPSAGGLTKVSAAPEPVAELTLIVGTTVYAVAGAVNPKLVNPPDPFSPSSTAVGGVPPDPPEKARVSLDL